MDSYVKYWWKGGGGGGGGGEGGGKKGNERELWQKLSPRSCQQII